MIRRSRVLGVDLSLRATGIAYGTNLHDLTTDTLHPPKQMVGERRRDWVSRSIMNLCDDLRPELVMIEAEVTPFGRPANDADRDLYMCHGVLRGDLFRDGRRYALISPAALKLLATSRGNAKKADMIDAARERLHIATSADDNACDAAWLWLCGMLRLGERVIELPKKNLTALDKIVWPEGLERDEAA